MTPIPMPIYIPHSSSGSGIEYIYPKWVTFIMGSGIALTVVSFAILMICFAIFMITDDDRFDPIEQPIIKFLGVLFIGITLMLIGLVLMLFFKTPITE